MRRLTVAMGLVAVVAWVAAVARWCVEREIKGLQGLQFDNGMLEGD